MIPYISIELLRKGGVIRFTSPYRDNKYINTQIIAIVACINVYSETVNDALIELDIPVNLTLLDNGYVHLITNNKTLTDDSLISILLLEADIKNG